MFPEITRDDVFRIETDRLWLRWPRSGDVDGFVEYAGDPDIALKTAAIPHPYSADDARDFIAHARAENEGGTGLCLALTPKRAPAAPIGVIGVHGADARGTAAMGFWLAKPFWGQGFMGEAAATFVDLVFGVSSLQELRACALPDNAASLGVLDKLGFQRLGLGTIDAPVRGGMFTVEWAKLTRGSALTRFAARRAKLTSA